VNPIENYCRQFHFIDIATYGKCQMCGGSQLLYFGKDLDRHITDAEPEPTEKEAIEAEQNSHTHP
jgi:hypothetical protein